MLSEKEMEEALKRAKKNLTVKQIKNTLKKCSCDGSSVNMDMKGGENYGKTNP